MVGDVDVQRVLEPIRFFARGPRSSMQPGKVGSQFVTRVVQSE